jgi:hypothetical protein
MRKKGRDRRRIAELERQLKGLLGERASGASQGAHLAQQGVTTSTVAPASTAGVANVTSAVYVKTSARSFSGPLPHPEILDGFEQLVPGAARQIIEDAHRQTLHRQGLERWAIKGDTIRSGLGLLAAMTISCGALLAGYKQPLLFFSDSGESPAMTAAFFSRSPRRVTAPVTNAAAREVMAVVAMVPPAQSCPASTRVEAGLLEDHQAVSALPGHCHLLVIVLDLPERGSPLWIDPSGRRVVCAAIPFFHRESCKPDGLDDADYRHESSRHDEAFHAALALASVGKTGRAALAGRGR